MTVASMNSRTLSCLSAEWILIELDLLVEALRRATDESGASETTLHAAVVRVSELTARHTL